MSILPRITLHRVLLFTSSSFRNRNQLFCVVVFVLEEEEVMSLQEVLMGFTALHNNPVSKLDPLDCSGGRRDLENTYLESL